MNDVIGKVTDVHRVLAYSGRKISRWFLQMGLVGLAAGAVLLYIQPGDFSRFEWIMVGFALAVAGVGALYGLVRLFVPGKPMLLMSPAGLRLHFDFLKTIVIPWHEVRGVDTIDIEGEFRGTPVLFTGVTVVLVSRQFYDRRIHVASWLLRGPGWDNYFIPKGDMVQVALHHDALPASAAELRMAAEARWLAFRNPPAR
jgi:hypothetical protein